jgi:GDPmannose 4,6-dehydratase
MAKKALLTGLTGQDGSYMAELLLDEGYEVFGMVRRLSMENYDRIEQFDGAPWAGVALDEADIIANMRGATSQRLGAMFRETPAASAAALYPTFSLRSAKR